MPERNAVERPPHGTTDSVVAVSGETEARGASVSVVLATYNGERYLDQQLDSLLAQSLLPDELIVGDDGSTDSTTTILSDFARSSPFPTRLVRRSQPLGPADNFLTTARLASGSLLTFCDQDDVWDPDKVRRVVDTFARYPAAVLVAHAERVIGGDNTPLLRHRLRPQTLRLWLRSPPACYPPGKAPTHHFEPGHRITVRRELLSSADPDRRPRLGNLSMPHDEWLWHVATCVGEVVVLADKLMSWRQHSANSCGFAPIGIERIPQMLSNDAGTYAYRSALADDRADYLHHLADSWQESGNGVWSSAAAERAALLRKVAEREAKREALYRIPDRASAASHWCQMLREGGYSYYHCAAKDLLRVAFGPAFWSKADAVLHRISAGVRNIESSASLLTRQPARAGSPMSDFDGDLS